MANTPPTEITYIALLFALFVLPRFLTPFRIPAAVTTLVLGAISKLVFGLFVDDATIQLLATFGIVSLFLFAGLEIDFTEVRTEKAIIIQHVVIFTLALSGVGLFIWWQQRMDLREAALVTLALLTPSTGFILSSIKSQPLSEREQFWIRAKSIAIELVALLVLFVVLQSVSIGLLTLSVGILTVMVGVLPPIFRIFAEKVAPFAPKSEFAFLLMVAVFCALVTRELGVYYLVGAFIVGATAQRLRKRLPAMTSENMLHAVEVFAAFFVPFYFFNAGLHLEKGEFSLKAVAFALVMLAIMTPIRLFMVSIHRKLTLGESFKASLRIGTRLLPTLVFSLVIVGILRDRFTLPDYVLGGIIIYTIINTILPSILFRLPPPEFEAPVLHEVPQEEMDRLARKYSKTNKPDLENRLPGI